MDTRLPAIAIEDIVDIIILLAVLITTAMEDIIVLETALEGVNLMVPGHQQAFQLV